MKKIQEKEDKLLADIMKDFQAENPSGEFTDRVMQSIETESSFSDLKSSPLIGRTGWIGIAASILGIIILLSFFPESQAQTEAGWLAQFFSNLNLPSFDISFENFLSRINFGSPTLFWITIGVAGIGFLALIERILESFKPQQFLLL